MPRGTVAQLSKRAALRVAIAAASVLQPGEVRDDIHPSHAQRSLVSFDSTSVHPDRLRVGEMGSHFARHRTSCNTDLGA